MIREIGTNKPSHSVYFFILNIYILCAKGRLKELARATEKNIT